MPATVKVDKGPRVLLSRWNSCHGFWSSGEFGTVVHQADARCNLVVWCTLLLLLLLLLLLQHVAVH